MSGSNDLSSAIMNLIDQHGGVSGLVQSFEAGGLGHLAESWIGSGQNHPVSPGQLQTVLDPQHVQNAAQQSGLSTEGFLAQLSQYLPELVNHVTPGNEPTQGGGWMSLASSFFKSR